MADFINTIDVLGDDAVIDSIIDRTITEFKDNVITKVSPRVFQLCTALVEIDLPKATELGDFAFSNCKNLSRVNFPEVVKVGTNIFEGTHLVKLRMPSLTSAVGGMAQSFRAMKQLATIDLPIITSISGYAFYQCFELKNVILRNDSQLVIISDNAFMTYVTDKYNPNIRIFVPRSMLEDYKVATNWVEYANQLFALEDYTVDGTITGELDESKI